MSGVLYYSRRTGIGTTLVGFVFFISGAVLYSFGYSVLFAWGGLILFAALAFAVVILLTSQLNYAAEWIEIVEKRDERRESKGSMFPMSALDPKLKEGVEAVGKRAMLSTQIGEDELIATFELMADFLVGDDDAPFEGSSFGEWATARNVDTRGAFEASR